MPWVTLTLGLIPCGFISSSQIVTIDNLHITDVIVTLSVFASCLGSYFPLSRTNMRL